MAESIESVHPGIVFSNIPRTTILLMDALSLCFFCRSQSVLASCSHSVVNKNANITIYTDVSLTETLFPSITSALYRVSVLHVVYQITGCGVNGTPLKLKSIRGLAANLKGDFIVFIMS